MIRPTIDRIFRYERRGLDPYGRNAIDRLVTESVDIVYALRTELFRSVETRRGD